MKWTIIICDERARNEHKKTILSNEIVDESMNAAKRKKSIKNKMMSENHFFVANSRFKSIFHQWRAFYRTQSCACSRFFLLSRMERRTIASHQKKKKTIAHWKPEHILSHSILFAYIFRHLSSSLSLLITNKKHVSTIYFSWNSLLEFVMMEFVVLLPPVTAHIDYLFK